MRLLLFALVCAFNVAHADPLCTDFSGRFKGVVEGKAVTLDIVQTSCDLIQSPTRMSLTEPNLKQLFLTNVPSMVNGTTVSGRIVGAWLQISHFDIDERGLRSTTVETLNLDNTNTRLMISIKNYDNTGLQQGSESDYDLIRSN